MVAASNSSYGFNQTSSPSPSILQQCALSMNGKLPQFVPEGFQFSKNVRRYYISSEIDTWDYVPSGIIR